MKKMNIVNSMLLLIFSSISCSLYGDSIIYNLDYNIENKSDAVVTVEFQVSNPDYSSPFEDWDGYAKKREQGIKNEPEKSLSINIKPGEHVQERINNFGISHGFYAILINGKKIAGGPLGEIITQLAPVQWYDIEENIFDKFIYSLESDYDENTSTAKFYYVIRNRR